LNEQQEVFTQLLRRRESGDRSAESRILALLVDELRRLAHREMRRQAGGHTLQTTALVNEAWLRLAGASVQEIQGREHFLALAARAMRSVMIDSARRRNASKRGAGAIQMTLEEDVLQANARPELLLQLDESMQRMQEVDPDLAQVAEMRVFGGLPPAEIAAATGRSQRSVERTWTTARAWLQRDLGLGEADG